MEKFLKIIITILLLILIFLIFTKYQEKQEEKLRTIIRGKKFKISSKIDKE